MSEALHQAKELATQLANILELEFQALREQELDQFEQLQPVKNDLLSAITALAPGAQELQQQPEWQDFRETMVICRDFHRRNTLLMNRKLDERVETIFMMPKDTYTFLSSRLVKEIARLGGDVRDFVPGNVRVALRKRLKE